MRRHEADGLGALLGDAVRGDHHVPAVLAQAGEEGVEAERLPLDGQAHLLRHQLRQFDLEAGELAAFEVVEGREGAFGGDEQLAAFLDVGEGAGEGRGGGQQEAESEEAPFHGA